MSHGGNVWSVRRGPPLPRESATSGQACLSPEEVLDFSADLNPLGPPPNLPELLQEARPTVRWYPEPAYRQFREAVASSEGVDPENILPGNGTAELIHLVSRWQAGCRAVVLVPTFTEYERAVLADRGKVVPWLLDPKDRFAPPCFDGSFPFPGTRLLFLCNPNNPTGTLWPRQTLLTLIETCEAAGTFCIVDEAYMDLVEDSLRYSLVGLAERFQRLITLRSMTKGFAIPGLRVGYLVASRQVVRDLQILQPPWSMNALAAFVGSRLIQDKGFLAISRKSLEGFRRSFWEGLIDFPSLRAYPTWANFFLCRIEDPTWSGADLADRLRDRGMLLRVCDDFRGLEPGRFVRIAIRHPEENRRLLEALREIFGDAG